MEEIKQNPNIEKMLRIFFHILWVTPLLTYVANAVLGLSIDADMIKWVFVYRFLGFVFVSWVVIVFVTFLATAILYLWIRVKKDSLVTPYKKHVKKLMIMSLVLLIGLVSLWVLISWFFVVIDSPPTPPPPYPVL